MKIIPLILALGLGVGGLVAPTVPATLQEGSVSIVAAPALPGVLRPGQALSVTGTVTNETLQSVDAGTAKLRVSSTKLATRTSVDRWLTESPSAGESPTGDPLGETQVGVLFAGQSKAFSVAVPATALPFVSGDTGVFPLEIVLTSDQGDVATQRSVVSLVTEGPAPQTNLALVTPLNAPPSSQGLLDATALELLTLPGGVLDVQLRTAIVHSVAMGVDPMIVASIRLLGENAPVSARAWLQLLEQAPNDRFLLSYADSDQLLLHEAGAANPLSPLSFPAQEDVVPAPEVTATPSGSATAPASVEPRTGPLAMHTTIDGLAWPARALSSADDLDFFSSGGMTRTLLSSSEVAGSVLSTPNVVVGKQQTTVSDDPISTLLRAAANAVTESEWAHAVANLSAMLAVTAAQSPDSTVVATFDRETAPNSPRIASTLSAIESLPWVTTIPLSSALELEPVVGSIVAAVGEHDTSLDRGPLTKELVTSELSLSQFSSVADDPTLITGPQRLTILALSSATWERDPTAWVDVARAQLSQNKSMLNSVRLPESSSITFLQEKGNLPIAVRNELDFPVTVYVTVRPERPILTVKDYQVRLTIEANAQAKASIPVESIANGEVRTTVSLSSPTGVAVSTPTIVVLNVQAGWETTATIVVAVLVVALFSAGIWRTVRRRRALRAARLHSTTPSETGSGIAAE